jgi:hypothetical protein
MGSYESISSRFAQEAVMVLTHTVNRLQELLTLLLRNYATTPHLPDVTAYEGVLEQHYNCLRVIQFEELHQNCISHGGFT